MTLEQLLERKRVCICAGSGGVGKTTTSAALALGLARRGRKVAVVTIDPARRLATTLGLESLDNEPRRVDDALLAQAGGEVSGELWAMMLDVRQTFDELITNLAPSPSAREEVLSNRIYQELSSAVAGSQEFTAIAKLYELVHERDFDVVVLDTPPSRNALDFLDAPGRLTQFLEGRALNMFLSPTGLAARVVGAGTNAMLAVLTRVIGVDLIKDLSGFLGSLSGLLDGFRERARRVDELLRDPRTAFLIVTSPQSRAADEAAYFHEKLLEAGMPFTGLIVNRVAGEGLDGHARDELAGLLDEALGAPLAARVAGNLADCDVLARRDAATIERLSAQLGEAHPVLVPRLDREVCDFGGLAAVERYLFG